MSDENSQDNIVIVVGIIGVVVLESVALYMGVDGQLLSTAVAAIAAMVGYTFGKKA